MTRADRLSRRGLEHEALLRIERRQVLEEQLVARLLGRFEVDRLDLDQREVALPFLRRPNLARDGVAGLQVELADLRRRHVDVVRAGQVVVVGRAQEAESVRQHFEHAFREDEAALLGLRLQDLEDQLLLAHAGRAGDVQVLGDLRELLDALVFQIGDVQAAAVVARLLAGTLCRRRWGRPCAACRRLRRHCRLLGGSALRLRCGLDGRRVLVRILGDCRIGRGLARAAALLSGHCECPDWSGDGDS